MNDQTDILAKIVSDTNLEESFDYVIGHLDNAGERARTRDRRKGMLARLKNELSSGRYSLGPVRTMTVTEGRKERMVQVPRIYDRVACHAVMVVVETLICPSFIRNTAAAIKGRGTHWLFHETERITRVCRPEELFFYKSDIRKYYDNINQDIIKAKVRRFVDDTVVLKYVDGFIELLPEGLSKGLRSSQMLANLYLSDVDSEMESVAPVFKDCKNEPVSGYFRYMDDVVILASDKRELWRLRERYHRLTAELGLEIKPDECVRPLTEGLDFLGFVNFGTHVRIRKHIKQRFARHMAKVKSRKRRQKLIGSFKGMAAHADARHLYKSLVNTEMKAFSDLNITYQPADGKKRFAGERMRLASLQNLTLEIHDFETGVKTSQGEGRCVVSFRFAPDGAWGKFFTASERMINELEQAKAAGALPFLTKIVSETFDKNKIQYKFT